MASKDFILTQDKLKEFLHYNPSNGDFTWLVRLSKCIRIGDKAGCKATHIYSGITYLRIRIKGKMHSAHRIAWLYVHGEFPKEIDHIDGNGLNNRLSNLRCVTRIENQRNQKLSSNNTSGITGITWYKRVKKWQAAITVNQRTLFLGHFAEKWDAICARKSEEFKYGFHPNHGKKRVL